MMRIFSDIQTTDLPPPSSGHRPGPAIMLGRVLKKPPLSTSTSFSHPSHAYPSLFPGHPYPGTRPPLDPTARKRDITFNERFLKPPAQPTGMATINRIRTRQKIERARVRQLPLEERRNYYLASRPLKQKLLDWAGTKVRAVTRTWGTVDAWTGPVPKNYPYKAIGATDNEVKVLGSGKLVNRLSDRAKRFMVMGMIVSVGGLMGWVVFGLKEKTRAEGPAMEIESGIEKKALVAGSEENRRPGLFVWGSNRGDVTAPGGNNDFVKSATRLAYFDGRALRDLALSNDLGVAVDENGDVIQWGRAYSHTFVPEPTLSGKNIAKVGISGENVICLSKSGKIYILPASKTALLSGPKPTESSWIPFWSDTASVSYTPLSLPEKVSQLATGDDHFILLSHSGKVYTVATTLDGNSFGQLGVQTSPDEIPLLTALEVKDLDRDSISAIAAGERHSLALTSRGNVYSWGSNAQGQLLQQYTLNNYVTPTPTIVPLQRFIPGIQHVEGIAAGGANSYVIALVNGDIGVYASGSGMWGQLGSGMWNQIQHRPVKVKAIQGLCEWSEHLSKKVNIGIRYMSVGENHVAAVLDNDISGGVGGRDVYIWGCGEAYQLGHGKRNNLNIPSPHNPMAVAEGRLAELNAERFMLKPRRKVEIVTADGRKKKVYCEEAIVFGGGCSAVYEKIVP